MSRRRRTSETGCWLVLALAVVVTACGPDVYITQGEVIEIGVDERFVMIAHEDIPGLGLAATSRFAVSTPDVLRAAVPGARVRVEIEDGAGQTVVRRLQPLPTDLEARPGVHDHTPHHGGVVTMIGLRHVEATARPDGRVLVFVSDAWRRPVSLDGWSGAASIGDGAERIPVELAVLDDRLEGRGPVPSTETIPLSVRLSPPSEEDALTMHALVAVRSGVGGLPVLPAASCVSGGVPRCTLVFSQPVTGVAAIGGTRSVLLAVTNGGVSVWSVDDVGFRRTLAAPPPLAGETNSGDPHPEIVDAVSVAPDGRQAIVASEGRLLRYGLAGGRLLRVLPSAARLPRAVAWSPAGDALLVTGRFESTRVLAAGDGQVRRTFQVDRACTAAAFSSDGRTVALGGDGGTIRIASVAGSGAGRRLRTIEPPVRGLGFAGERVVAASGAGVIRVIDTSSGEVIATSAPESPCHRLAVSADAAHVACAAFDRRIGVYATATGERVRTLEWHEALVQDLAWVGPSLVSADAAGRVAVWDALP